MLRITRILAPTDFSELGDAALPAAETLARIHGATVIVLHALPGIEYSPFLDLHELGDPSQVLEMFERRARIELHGRAERLAVPAEARVVGGTGNPGDAIVSCARELEAQLIVMATHGRRGLRRAFIGSVAEHVLRRSPCPVLVVRPQGTAPFGSTEYRSILVPVDFSWCSWLALTYAREIAKALGAMLMLLHVVSESSVPGAYGFGPGGIRITRRAAELEAGRRLAEAAGRDSPADAHRTLVRCGHPAVEILRCARETGVDLILMGSHGLGGFARLMLGSVTSRVVHRAPCSVLVTGWGRRLVPGLRVLSSHYPEVETAPEAGELLGARRTLIGDG